MIFKNLVLHNVSELEETPTGGFKMLRSPKSVEEKLNPTAQRTNRFATGVEIRFIMNEDTTTLTLRTAEDGYFTTPLVYFGNLAGGWTDSTKLVTNQPSKITINKPDLELAKRVSKENNYPFDPEVVRVIFSGTMIELIDIEDNVSVPSPLQMPKDYCVFYGSSITNGSLALNPASTFVYRIAESLKLDYLNLGYSGSAHCEIEMAEHIASLKGMKFIGLEMGANMGGEQFTPEAYKARVKPFIEKIATTHSNIPIFCVDQFYTKSDLNNEGWSQSQRVKLREALQELDLPNTVYIDGSTIMTSSKGLSADYVHPNIVGVNEIYNNYLPIIKKHLN